MGKKITRNTRVGIIGSTNLTLKCMQSIKDLIKIKYVFGLSSEQRQQKVNSVDMKGFCDNNDIALDTSNEWQNLENQNLDLIISLGDSRIIPSTVLQRRVIGNHGALLPFVKGGASLVWGRMVNNGKWGVSIFELNKSVDTGDILVLKPFEYNINISMREFVDIADNKTVEGLLQFLKGDYAKINNPEWNIKIAKHTDSEKATSLLRYAIDNNINIYMPPRTPDDAKIEKCWGSDFITKFKTANAFPYPCWI